MRSQPAHISRDTTRRNGHRRASPRLDRPRPSSTHSAHEIRWLHPECSRDAGDRRQARVTLTALEQTDLRPVEFREVAERLLRKPLAQPFGAQIASEAFRRIHTADARGAQTRWLQTKPHIGFMLARGRRAVDTSRQRRRLSDHRLVRITVAVVAFIACLAALVLALVFLFGVVGGAVGDARSLTKVSPWALLAFPALWG